LLTLIRTLVASLGEFADRARFFYQGKILEQGPPDRLFNRPRSERTQAFLRAVLES
jgi:polar amino acid transport system ATP-binding protein